LLHKFSRPENRRQHGPFLTHELLRTTRIKLI